MENKIYKTEKVNDHLIRIIGLSNEFAYLVIGSSRALLIDTCCGVGNIREVVESLTDLDYDVVLTHGHVDHIGGVGNFKDKKLFLSKVDHKSAAFQGQKLVIKMYLKNFLKLYRLPLKVKNFSITDNRGVKYSDLKENQEFDLGGIHIQAISLPGHTKGMMTLLFKEDRILLSSDACNPSTFLFLPGCLSVKDYKEQLINYIPKVEGKYDKVILSHLPKVANVTIFKEMVDICSDVISGKKPEDELKQGIFKAKVAKKYDHIGGFREDEGSANLFY